MDQSLENTKNKNVIISPTGSKSFFLNLSDDICNFDIFFLCYEDTNLDTELRKQNKKAYKYKGEKWQIIKKFLDENENVLKTYDLFWFPDDDLQIDEISINNLFDIHKNYNLLLSQPSASGFLSHNLTRQNKTTILRYTNFVEIMCPLMSKNTLLLLKETFNESVSGYGLDLLWPKQLNYPKDKIAIIDEVSVHHVNKVGHNYQNRFMVSPTIELRQILSKYNLQFNLVEYSYIIKDKI